MRVVWNCAAALAAASLLAGLLAGCATIIEGTTQTITVEVVPAHGTCVVTRQGEEIGVSTPDRRAVTIPKSQHDLTFSCTAEGYIPKTDTLSSSLAAATVASFLLLDFGIVDAATGAWKKYPERVTVVLTPAPRPVPAAPTRRRPGAAGPAS
jgi:hypothetical protein